MAKIEAAMNEVDEILTLAFNDGLIESYERIPDENAYGVEIGGHVLKELILKVELP